jgi:flagellar protein FlaF
MSQAHEAYAAANRRAVNSSDPRSFEAELLTKAAGRLQRAKDAWQEGYCYNRQIWTVFASSAAEKEHPLPHEIKQNIANLALFIFKRTAEIEAQREPRPQLFDPLISINRDIAAGLAGRP